MFDLETINDIPLRILSRGEREVMRSQRSDGSWASIPASELYGKIRALARTLESWGVVKGDRVVLVAENRVEWPITDFAVLGLGAVDVPLYPTVAADQLRAMLEDCGAKVAVLSNKDHLKRLHDSGHISSLERVVLMDAAGVEGVDSFEDAIAGWEELRERDEVFDARLRSVTSEDLATIIYTSGTTGQPKGAGLTHGNLASNVNVTTDEMGFTKEDSAISFLPLSHVTARHLDYAFLCHGALVAYLPRFDKLREALRTIQPTIFLAVPRVYEKIRQAVEGKANASKVRARLLRWALGVGERHRGEIERGRTPGALEWKLANGLVFTKVREAFGGRVHTFSAGGAPLGLDTARWFADVGIRILEGYGMTETSPVIAVNTPKHYRLGSVGRPVPNIEVRLAGDGELEVRGPSVFSGYWKRDDETAKAFDGEGWFRTGDIAKLEDGYLTITDRKKELLKTSGGKIIAPQPIENKLKVSGLVGQAAMVGDRRKFAVVLISPNFEELERWAQQKGIRGDHAALVQDEAVKQEYKRLVNEVNGQLGHWETMKKVTVVPDEWTPESGELTPTMKLKRRVIEEKYKDAIQKMYGGDGDQAGE